MFEVLVFRSKWFDIHKNDDLSLKNLSDLVNKAYAKQVHRYSIVLTPRVVDYKTFVESFRTTDNEELTFCVILLSETKNQELKSLGMRRTFQRESNNFNESYNFDVPDKFADNLKVENNSMIYIEVANDFVFSDTYLVRALGTLAFKQIDSTTYELTAFTSYLRNLAPKFLDAVVYNLLLSSDQVDKITLLANCFKEHNLVSFYENKCGFKLADKPNVILEVKEEDLQDWPFGNTLRFTKNITVVFLEKIYRKDP